jgi:hypothetical protein
MDEPIIIPLYQATGAQNDPPPSTSDVMASWSVFYLKDLDDLISAHEANNSPENVEKKLQ